MTENTKQVENQKPEKEQYDLSSIKKSINDYNQPQPQGETDPDLMVAYEIIQLPSQGLFYPNNLSELKVEYMTSKDEDLLTTPSLIENGTVINLLLKRKIKNNDLDVNKLLAGDRNAIILFLRTSSYGNEYTVSIPDPRTGIPFKTTVDLYKLEYKEIKEKPDKNGHFSVFIPMRKKDVKFKLLTSGEENYLYEQAESLQETYATEFSEFNTMRLKASIVSINDKTDRSYIDKFVDAMPAGDALTIRKKILAVSPDINMAYEFTAKDGYKFWGKLELGSDFFFPEN